MSTSTNGYIFVSSCSAASSPIPAASSLSQTLQTSTDSYQATVTPTQIPLSEIDLKQALVPRDDLPSGLIVSKTKDNLPNLDVPEPTKLICQQIERGMKVAGGLRIYLYESTIDVKDAYDIESNNASNLAENSSSLSGIGETAQISSSTLEGKTVTDLVFIRCYSVATIRIIDSPNQDEIINFGTQLDDRLKGLVCRYE